MQLYLLRHGEVECTRLRHYGQTDLPLSARGLAQAEAAAAALAHLDIAAVLSSDLQRASIGADLVAKLCGAPHRIDPALREIDLGLLEGVDYEEATERFPELHAFTYRDLVGRALPEGETLVEVAARVRPVLQDAISRYADQTIVMVAHNSVTRIVLADALGLPLLEMFTFRQDYGCVNRIDYADEGASVGLVNWTPEAPIAPEPAHFLRHLSYAS